MKNELNGYSKMLKNYTISRSEFLRVNSIPLSHGKWTPSCDELLIDHNSVISKDNKMKTNLLKFSFKKMFTMNYILIVLLGVSEHVLKKKMARNNI